MIKIDDFIISLAYFFIPLQILVTLKQYPRLASMSWRLLLLVLLFVLFIFLCGAGHLMRCLGRTETTAFSILNTCTAVVSLMTSVYLLLLAPRLFDSLDGALHDLVVLEAGAESKKKLMTFLSFLCHEIRNPLFAITSTITFLEDEYQHEDGTHHSKIKSALSCIHSSANVMLRLVNDVLDISKLESGKLKLEEHAFDLRDLMQGTAECVHTQIDQKRHGKVSFDFSMSSRVPRVVRGDSVRLLQIAYNLLSNAAKFTEEGFVKYSIDIFSLEEALQNGHVDETFSLQEPCTESTSATSSVDSFAALLEVEEGRGEPHTSSSSSSLMQQMNTTTNKPDTSTVVLKMEVQDSGPGIAEDRLTTLFEPYAHSLEYRRHGGTGLGLSILDRLIRIMGGNIQVQSKVGEGSTFTVFVPVQIPATAMPLENCCQAQDQASHEMVATLRMPEILTNAMVVMEQDSTTLLLEEPPLVSPRPAALADGSFTLTSCLVPETALASTKSPTATTRLTTVKETPTQKRKTQPRDIRKGSSSSLACNKFDFPTNDNIVLVVDDNAINRKLFGRMLSHFQLQHEDAIHGQEAVDFMVKSRNHTGNPQAPQVGLILMDWSMPVMDGCQAIREIRKLGIDVPIIAVTACALEERKQDLLQAGANDFATKPLLRDDLLDKCRRYLQTATTTVRDDESIV